MLAEKELATVGRMADGRLFVSRVDLLHAYVHALAIARQVKEYLGGTTNTGTADGDTSSNLSFSPRLVEDLFDNAISTLQQIRDTHPDFRLFVSVAKMKQYFLHANHKPVFITSRCGGTKNCIRIMRLVMEIMTNNKAAVAVAVAVVQSGYGATSVTV
jgi:hypothetical protein